MVGSPPEDRVMHQEGVGVRELVEGVGCVFRPHVHHQHLHNNINTVALALIVIFVSH